MTQTTRPSRPSPLWFGPAERPLLGFFHAAGGPSRRRCAVVLCPPFGHEYTAVYQAYRHLAEQLAAAGFAVLRFDYDGTGDSAGSDADPGRVRSWLASIGAAVDEARVRSGVDEVCLFGLRLGAVLAYLAAAERPSVRSLILWAPSPTGRAYLRELRAMRMLKDQGAQPGANQGLKEGDEEAGGFLLAAETLADLGRIDLSAAPVPAIARALILARDTVGVEKRLAERVRSSGAEAEFRYIPGYAKLVVEPYNVVIPEAVFGAAIEWLGAAYPVEETGPPGEASVSSEPASILIPNGTESVRESVVRFGPGDALLGILSERSAGEGNDSERPALLLLNTSVIHRVGANRMYVPMARRWAALGFPVFRIDLSGVGDSPKPGWQPRQNMYSMEAVDDVRAAMDFLSKSRGLRRFILIGLCSGAYMAFHTGLADRRVLAQVLLNPQTFEWKEGDSVDVGRRLEYKSFRFYLRRAVQRETWARLLQGRVHWKEIFEALGERALKSARTRIEQHVGQHIGPLLGKLTPQNKTLAGFREILQRGTQMLLLYSQEDPGLDELALHLGKDAEFLRRFSTFRLILIDGPDHTFTPVWSQRRIEEIITERILMWSRTSRELSPNPLPPEWIEAGTPTARSVVLTQSEDQLLSSGLWECTAGRFKFIHDSDEIVRIVEGKVTVRHGGVTHELGVGDVAHFPEGATTYWDIPEYVKKFWVQRAPRRSLVGKLRARLGV